MLECLCEMCHWFSISFMNEATLFATLKFHCQSLYSLKDRFCGFHKAYLVLHCSKHSALLEQDIVLRNNSLVTVACHIVLVGDDQPKENTRLFSSTFHTVRITCKPCLFASRHVRPCLMVQLFLQNDLRLSFCEVLHSEVIRRKCHSTDSSRCGIF